MSLIAWTDEIGIGVAQMDDDHKLLIGIINELYDAMIAERDVEAIDGILARLKESVRQHFTREEAIMLSCGYDSYEEHRRHHVNLIGSLDEFMQMYWSKKGGVDQVRLLVFLQGWLINHIKLDDFQFRHYLKKSGRSVNPE